MPERPTLATDPWLTPLLLPLCPSRRPHATFTLTHPGLSCRHVTDADFDVGGPLHHVQMELLLWASYRGQLLARTVRWAVWWCGVGWGGRGMMGPGLPPLAYCPFVCLPACSAYLPSYCLPACLLTCPPACSPARLPACLPTGAGA